MVEELWGETLGDWECVGGGEGEHGRGERCRRTEETEERGKIFLCSFV